MRINLNNFDDIMGVYDCILEVNQGDKTTKQHMQALRDFGPSPIHRKKFIRFLDEE